MTRISTIAATALLLLPAGPIKAASETTWPTQVNAVYSMHFTGLGELGKFKFQSQMQGETYTVKGNADIKIPLVYTWSGKIEGSGRVAGDEPAPASYTFNSHGKPLIGSKYALSIDMGIHESAVSKLAVVPPAKTAGTNFVPLKPEHMKNIVDPLTAIMMTSRAKGGSPCGRRIPVFDGKQRYDLLTSSAGQQKVPEALPSGQPAIGYVCKVRYVPVAGYKDTEDMRKMVNDSAAEVALRPVPSANLLVPYRITVKTKWGTATMLLQRMDIVTPEQKQIALIH